MTTEGLRCSDCGSTNLVPTVYGILDRCAMDLIQQGRIYLGSSLRTGDLPDWYCKDCDCEIPHTAASTLPDSASSRLREQVLKKLRKEYRPLPRGEHLLLQGRNTLESLVRTLTINNPKEIHLSASDEEGGTQIIYESERESIPAVPEHAFHDILRYFRARSAPAHADGEPQLEVKMSVRGQERTFCATLEKSDGGTAIVIRPSHESA